MGKTTALCQVIPILNSVHMKKVPWASDLTLQEAQLIDVAWEMGILKLESANSVTACTIFETTSTRRSKLSRGSLRMNRLPRSASRFCRLLWRDGRESAHGPRPVNSLASALGKSGPIIPAQAGIHAPTIKLALSNSTPIGSPVLRVNGRWKMVKAGCWRGAPGREMGGGVVDSRLRGNRGGTRKQE